jgi:hypothetical protein
MNAIIKVKSLKIEEKFADVVFEIETSGCTTSSCAHFDIELVFTDKKVTTHSIEGWTIENSDNSEKFTLKRSIVEQGLKNIKNIEQPEFICN